MSRGNRPIGIGMDRVTPTEAYETGWDDGVQDSMLRATQYERILTDLIAELRDIPTQNHVKSWGGIVEMFSAIKPSTCVDAERVEQAADHAEKRLREVQGE